jgi:hypothetical protein
LKRLALYNVDTSSEVDAFSDIDKSSCRFVLDIQQCRNLAHLVLTRSDGLDEMFCPTPQWYIPHENYQISRHLQRVLIVNTAPRPPLQPCILTDEMETVFRGQGLERCG